MDKQYDDLLYGRGLQNSNGVLVHVNLKSLNIVKLDFGVFNEICKSIGTRWREIAALASNTRYQLEVDQVERCAQVLMRDIHASPARQLLSKFADLNMSVGELAIMLDYLHLERALKTICEPVALRITQHPVPAVTVTEGEQLELNCYATGFPYPQYCWFKEEEQLTFSTDCRLVLNLVSLSCAGRYLCRIHHTNHVTNEVKCLFTKHCNVTVEPRAFTLRQPTSQALTCPGGCIPRITKQPVSQTIRLGESISLTCSAFAQPDPQYDWYRDDILVGASTQHFLVEHSTLGCSGEYHCVVKNIFGNCRSNAAIITIQPEMLAKVSVKPQILKQPVDQTVGIGGDVIFSIDVDYCGKLCYQWYHDSNIIPDATSCELRLKVDGFYVKGHYQCRVYAATDKQEVLSRQALLTVTPGPTVYTAADKLALFIGVSTYKTYNVPLLPAVEHDLQESVKVFEQFGFKVISLLDLTLSEMTAAIKMFCGLLSPNVYTVFYCAGHGFVGEDGRHYLVPWDAHHDTNPNESLCIESVEDDIQRTQPKLLMFFLDICRKRHQNIDAPPQAFTRAEAVPNKIVLYAASEGQQAFEENRRRVPRGLFNKYLLDVIHKPMHAVDLYYSIMDKFKTCEYDRSKYRQSPEMLLNIEDYCRTLHDPINKKVYELQINKTKLFIQRIHNLPAAVTLQIAEFGKVDVSYERVTSNVLDVKFVGSVRDGWQLTVCLSDEFLPAALRPVHSLTDNNTTYIRLKNLQQLSENLQLHVYFELISGTQPTKRQPTNVTTLNVGLPLIAAFPLDRPATVADIEPTDRKQAMEHTEDHSLQSDTGSTIFSHMD